MLNLRCYFELIRKDLFLLKKRFFPLAINTIISVSTRLIVFSYFMNEYMENFGLFILIGIIAANGIREVASEALLLSDDANHKKLDNFLTLPIKSSFYFISKAISYFIQVVLLTMILIPFSKIILWNKFNLSNFSIVKFVIIFLISSLFYSFFALWMSSIVKDLKNMEWIWTRIINPIQMFCGSIYTWSFVYKISPIVAYLHFLNPALFAVEGMRAAVLGQNEYLNFWICTLILILLTIVFGIDAIRRFKKRIDYV